MTSRFQYLRRVVSADLQSGGNSIFKSWMSLGSIWALTLECGHIIYRQPRYKPDPKFRNGWGKRRKPWDALPAPKHAICERCQWESEHQQH